MIPDGNNVYGHIVTPRGLEPVLVALRSLLTDGRVWLKTSGYDGTMTLHLETDTLDFVTTPLGGGRHLFNGGVAGSTDEVIAQVAGSRKRCRRSAWNTGSRSTTWTRTSCA